MRVVTLVWSRTQRMAAGRRLLTLIAAREDRRELLTRLASKQVTPHET